MFLLLIVECYELEIMSVELCMSKKLTHRHESINFYLLVVDKNLSLQFTWKIVCEIL
jgi:hypothetical protein